MHYRRAPAAEMFARQRIFQYIRMLRQNRVDCPAEIADAFTVNDSHAQDAALLALAEVVGHKLFNLAWLKRVQVQHAVNGQFDRLVHLQKLNFTPQNGKIDSAA